MDNILRIFNLALPRPPPLSQKRCFDLELIRRTSFIDVRFFFFFFFFWNFCRGLLYRRFQTLALPDLSEVRESFIKFQGKCLVSNVVVVSERGVPCGTHIRPTFSPTKPQQQIRLHHADSSPHLKQRPHQNKNLREACIAMQTCNRREENCLRSV